MYKIILLTLSFCLFSGSAFAQESENAPPTRMDVIAKSILPLVFDTHQIHKVDATKELHKHLNELQLSFEHAALQNMVAHLEQAQKSLEHKEEAKARDTIKLILSFCLASDPKAHLVAKERDLSPLHFASQFEIAEYNYIIQNYEAAIIYYDHYLTAKKPQHKAKDQSRLALERLLSIYTQIERDPSVAAAYLNEYQSYVSDASDKATLQQWIQDLNTMKSYFDDELQSSGPPSFTTIQSYATRILENNSSESSNPETEKIKRLILKGLVFNYLNEKNTVNEKEKPLLIDWLAQCYN